METDRIDESRFCEDCPVRSIQDEFSEMLDNELPPPLKRRWSASFLRRTVFEVMALENGDIELTETADRLVGIIKSERMRIDRIERWNRQKANQNGER